MMRNKESQVIRTIGDDEGFEYVIAEITGGFSVTIHDKDSGEYVPTHRIYKTVDAAIAFAEANL